LQISLISELILYMYIFLHSNLPFGKYSKNNGSFRLGQKTELTGVKLKSAQTLNGHNSIIFKYYEKEKYRF